MIAERRSSGVTRAVLGAVRPVRSGRAGQTVAGHVVTLLSDVFALALLVAVGPEMVRIAFRLTVKTGPARKTQTLAGVGLAASPVNTGTRLGTVGTPIAPWASVRFAPGAGEPWGARADVGFDADPVFAGFFADGVAGFLVRHSISGAALPVVDQPGDVLLLDGLHQLRLEHRTPEKAI